MTEELFTKALNTITTKDYHKHDIIKFTFKMLSAKFGLGLGNMKGFVYFQGKLNNITKM
jgi:hypothetical protein